MPTLAYLGNFTVPYSTENHVAHAWEANGWTVHRIQEGDTRALAVADEVASVGADLFCWTQTYGLAEQGGHIDDRQTMLDRLRALEVPSIGWHLDLWHGLAREDQLAREPFFRVDRLFTANGDGDWSRYRIAHRWLRPAVHGPEVGLGEPDRRYVSDVAFVGNWRGQYHAEWPWRRELVAGLRRRYRGRIRFWPQRQAVRGDDLRALYASVKVVVGDSCFADRSTFYVSDRPYEAVGRGAFLVMPAIPVVQTDFVDGEHLRLVEPCDLGALFAMVDRYLDPSMDGERDRIRKAGVAHVADRHTYTHRVAEVVDTLTQEGLL